MAEYGELPSVMKADYPEAVARLVVTDLLQRGIIKNENVEEVEELLFERFEEALQEAFSTDWDGEQYDDEPEEDERDGE